MVKKPPTTKPIAGYPRVSRKGDRDDDKFKSPEFQRSLMERYAEAHGITLQMFDPEVDVSGSKPERKILDGIIARIESGELGGILVAKLDRLSRLKPRDRIDLFDRIEGAGGVVLSASEQLDVSTPEGRFARDVFLGVARMQWEKYREGFETSKENAIAEGIPIHTRPPLGYRARKDRRLEPDPRTAPIVRELFERRARGEGPGALSTFLQSKKVTTSQFSRTWTKSAVYDLIGNRVYLGELSYGKDRRFVNPSAHEAIVDLELFMAAQSPNGKLKKPRSPRSPWLLAGIARCRACGYSMQGTTTSRGRRIYRCQRTHAGGVCPAPARVDADVLEELAVADFWKLTAEIEARGKRDDGGKVAKLEATLERSEKRLSRLLSPAVQDEVGDTAEWARALGEARRARDEAASALGQARARADRSVEVLDTKTLRKAWADMSTVEHRELLGLRFDCIAVGDGVVAFQKGTGPLDLPSSGFRREPRLAPIDVPRGARMLAA